MINAYPDSIGGTLKDLISILQNKQFKNTFSSFYILPSLFHTDLDRGFSVIDYSLNKKLASQSDLQELEAMGIDLKLDFILNHASVLSSQFQDILEKGADSEYCDFFIDWNKFWDGYGTMTEQGYIQPDKKYIKDMFFRKPGLPILMVRFPDGRQVPYWNTFYQEIKYPHIDSLDVMKAADLQYQIANEIADYVNHSLEDGKRLEELDFTIWNQYSKGIASKIIEMLEKRKTYLGQMDLNIKSELVWKFYEETLNQLSAYGAKIIRLDAFAYAPKEPGEKNFLNEPGTWELLEQIHKMADTKGVGLLPEIHAGYEDKIYETIAKKGYMTYDFFLPGLIIDALESEDGSTLANWANELVSKKIRTVNMLGCHDGIPLLDLKGLLPEERIQTLIDIIVKRGGYVKDLHGEKKMYYQVNATFFSALGEDEKKMLMARAIQLFMPGKPQIWYLDLFAGSNDYEAVKRAGAGGHKEINRTNLSMEDVKQRMNLSVVQKQLELLRYRNTSKAFDFDSEINIDWTGTELIISWSKDVYKAALYANLSTLEYKIL